MGAPATLPHDRARNDVFSADRALPTRDRNVEKHYQFMGPWRYGSATDVKNYKGSRFRVPVMSSLEPIESDAWMVQDPTKKPKIAAVVLYYRLGEQLHQTLDALVGQTRQLESILIVDNASGDTVAQDVTTKFAERGLPKIERLQLSQNLGYAGGMNAGFAHMSEHGVEFDFVLFCTHEVLLSPDCLQQMVTAAVEGGYGAVGPALLRTSDSTVWSKGGRFTGSGDVRHTTQGHGDPIDWLDGACLLVNRSAFTKVEGFDERYFLYWEDVDFSNRVIAHGGIKCVQNAHAQQDTSTAPLYFRTRGYVLFWSTRRHVKFTIIALAATVARCVTKDIPQQDWRRARARMAGALDGLSRAKRDAPDMIREAR